MYVCVSQENMTLNEDNVENASNMSIDRNVLKVLESLLPMFKQSTQVGSNENLKV